MPLRVHAPQTDVLNAVHERSEALGSIARAPIGNLFPLAKPLTMPSTATLRQCFKQLNDHGYVHAITPQGSFFIQDFHLIS